MQKIKLACAISFILLLTASAAMAEPITFRFAGQAPPDHTQTKTMRKMADEIKDATNGRVEVLVYPANQLGTYALVYEEMIRGTIDMAIGGIASEFDPRLELININGYANTYEDIKKYYSPGAWIPKTMEELSSQIGVRIIGQYIDGFNGVASMKPVNEPLNPKVDKGVLSRATTMDTYSLGARAMGFRIITIPYADVYQAMQTGVCDATVGFSAAAAYTILGDVIKYWYATNYAVECSGMMISEKSWQKLTPEDRQAIHAIAQKYTLISIDNAQQEDEKYMNLMQEKGIKVYRYNREELQPLKDALESVWPELAKRGIGKELMDQFTVELTK